MFKEFFEKIQSLEEGKRRQIMFIAVIAAGVFVFIFWINQFKAILENQSSAPVSKPDGLPSIQDNLKSNAKELWDMVFNFGDYLKSEFTPQPQTITPAPQPNESLPPAVRLPQ